MQVCPQTDFNDRMVFYSSFPIRNRVGRGKYEGRFSKMRYKLPPIYIIGILDFELSGVSVSGKTIRHFSIREDDGGNEPFTDSIHYVTVELPKFRKSSSELESRQDYMLYAIKNAGDMKEIPEEFSGKGFDKLFEVCSFANMTEEMQMRYVRKVMAEWDREGQLATAIMTGEARGRAKGLAEGRAEGRTEERFDIAKKMLKDGMATEIISTYTGLTPEQIEAL